MAEPTAVAAVLRIDLHDLVHGENARGDLGDVTELANSLKVHGQQVPLIVEPAGGKWSVFDGNRRLKAARLLNRAHLLAIPRNSVLEGMDRVVRQLAIQATAKSFDPMAEARAIEWLIFADDGPHLDRDEVAAKLARSPSWVKGRLDLLQLPRDEQRSVAAGTLSVSAALQAVAARRGAGGGGQTVAQIEARRERARGCPPRCSCVCHERNVR